MFFLCGFSLNAQVTIGMGEAPTDGALLQLKESEVTDDGPNATKGLEFPRVQLTNENNLYPMFYDNSTSGPTSAYTQNKSTLDKTHCGLIGLYIWNGSKWIAAASTPVTPWRESVSQKMIDSENSGIYRTGNVTIGTTHAKTEDMVSEAVLHVASASKGVLLPKVDLKSATDIETLGKKAERNGD